MATIAQNLAVLQQARTDIAEAIENKGVTLEEGAGFTDFPQAIDSISGGSANLQIKSVTPIFTAQTITPDEGYDGLSQVNISSIPYTETDNDAGGITITIGGAANG